MPGCACSTRSFIEPFRGGFACKNGAKVLNRYYITEKTTIHENYYVTFNP